MEGCHEEVRYRTLINRAGLAKLDIPISDKKSLVFLAHCQGDAAIEEYLNALEAVYGANPAMGLMRLEHATMVRQDQLERIKKLGYQLTFMTEFVYLYGAAYRDSIFGPERAAFMVLCAAAHKTGLQYSVHSVDILPVLKNGDSSCETRMPARENVSGRIEVAIV